MSDDKKKVILCSTDSGQYEIPLRAVAEHRADYYACEVDGHKKGSADWQKEIDYAVEDSYESIDWLLGNTNWEDWESVAVKINDEIKMTGDSLEDGFWCDSENFEVVTK